MKAELMNLMRSEFESAQDKTEFLNEVKSFLHELSGNKNPVNCVRWVDASMVRANDYNPNSVAKNEMRLLYVSIKHDGFTQPIVTVFDEKTNQFVIVDGFHRYSIMKTYKDIAEKNGNKLPIVVLDKDINDRMASTVRHNRARGKHSVNGMASMVFEMLENGWSDSDICHELGMEAEELVRLKHVTGFSKLFENVEYQKAWETNQQIRARKLYEQNQAKKDETITD